MSQILAGALFVLASTFTAMVMMVIGVFTWESLKDRNKKQ